MKINLARKALVVGIIILFLTAGIIPIIGSVRNNLNQRFESTEYTSFDPFKEGWFYQKKVTINHELVEEDLSNFPLLISIIDSDLANKAQNDGDDILFMDDTGYANRLFHEIEFFNHSSGELICWVNVTSLSSNEDTEFYMYYGNPGCDCQEEISNTWDSNFVLVQHLDETTGIHYDSSIYGNNGTCVNGTDQNAVGYIDGADSFDGSKNWINCGNNDSLYLPYAMTLEAWVNKGGDGFGKYLGIISRAQDTSTGKYNRYQLRYKPEDTVVHFFLGNDTDYTIITSDNDLVIGDWTHLVATWDGSNMQMFVDGVKQEDVGFFNDTTLVTSAVLEIGRYWDINFFEGIIDEVRISNINRDSSWIITEYTNQYNPSDFLTIGPEIKYLYEWQYRKKITIQHDMVEGDLSNFPILINTIDSDLASKAQSDGDDILFIDDSAYSLKLCHEIEKYDGSSGELICWVNISSVSSTEDTIFYMYYGNPNCNSQENPECVWDSSFVMVQHLDETSGTHYDSTVYSNDGTCVNGTDQNAAGPIDGADGFDGTNDWIDCGNDDSLNLPEEMTLEAWVNRSGDGIGKFPSIISRRGSSFNRYQLRYKPDEDVAQFFLGKTSNYTILSSDEDLALDVWYHLVATWNGTSMQMFVNGVKQSNVTNFTGSPNTNSATLELGRYTEASYFQGLVDEVRISDIHRDSDWIITEFNNQNDPTNFLIIGPEEGGENHPPTPPEIGGPPDGVVGVSYTYTFVSIDPDGDNVLYKIIWGDGTDEEWLGPYPSGEILSVDHTWTYQGTFLIYSKAKDTESAESEWSYKEVVIPRNRMVPHTMFFKWILDNFPIIYRILYLKLYRISI